ncbi:hypothetical protein LDG_8264 [Legionella drancourtii LLAP12]|uniref:Uncharacterized protein n=1 Tax=Legionella drancourtii LLAP12 TaxID=658187 RepID=G9ESJ1_9GAMM|nr:hypothetical protein LDG_8264 [Legionella drancourtii LLAP12]
MTSPEQGAQHECSNNLSAPLGNSNRSLSIIILLPANL